MERFLNFLLQGESEVVTINGYHDVPQNSEDSLLKALANQPLSVAIEASSRDFQFYSGVSPDFVIIFLFRVWPEPYIYIVLINRQFNPIYKALLIDQVFIDLN